MTRGLGWRPGERGSVEPDCWKADWVSSQPMKYTAMLLSMIVTITSLAPVRALRTPAIPAQIAPPMIPPRPIAPLSSAITQ